MEVDVDFERIEALYENYKDRHEDVLSECLPRVAEWRWASDSMYKIRPYGLEMEKKGRWIRTPRPGSIQYGLKSDGEPIISRLYIGQRYDKETFYYRSDTEAMSLTYSVGGAFDELLLVEQTEYRDTVPVRYVRLGKGSITRRYIERYTANEGYICHARCTSYEGSRTVSFEHEYEHDANGDIVSIRWRYPGGESGTAYLRKSQLSTSKEDLIGALRAHLTSSAIQTVTHFRAEHLNERLYAFAFVTSAEGNRLHCAFATEEGLDRIAMEYISRGFRASKGDHHATLRTWLRWMSPEDGWYIHDLHEAEALNRQLDEVYASGIYKLYDNKSTKLYLDVLVDVDRANCFGAGIEREAIAIGLSIPDDPEHFIKSARRVNPKSVADRTRKEFVQGIKLEQFVHTS